MANLSPKQKEIIQVLQAFIDAAKIPPSVSELTSMFGYKSKGAIHYQLHQLKKLGYVTIKRHKERGLRLTDKVKEVV